MASIRRTLSPAHHDRTYQNGAASPAANTPLSISSSPSQKHFNNNSTNNYSILPLRKFLASIFLQRRHRFRRSLYQCFIFFLLGLFIGFFLYSHEDNANDSVNANDFSFEIKPPHVNVQLDDGDNRSIKHDEFGVSLNFIDANQNFVGPIKQLIVITPTYNRALQAYFLNRLGQLLKLVQPPLLWIVVEMKTASLETADMLRKTGVMYRHLVCDKNFTDVKDRGVYQRNTALEHIERHKLDGIVYFADDDNVYSIELFESLRDIR
jgi:hypothetical protein